MNKTKTTLVLGASDNPDRYSFKAINMLRKHEHPVWAVGSRAGKVRDVKFSKKRPDVQSTDIDTVTIYLNAQNQKSYHNYILSLHPKRIIFNPGAENSTLYELAEKNGIEPIKACTLVLLNTGQY